MKYKIIPCRNMNDVPDVVLARIVSFLDPISQCNVAPVSSVLRPVVASQADSKGGPITPEQRRLAARSYFKTVILEDLIASIRHGERNPGVLYEEAFSILPHSVRDHFESIFLGNLKKYTLNEPTMESVLCKRPKHWAIEALRDIVTHVLAVPGQEKHALRIVFRVLPDFRCPTLGFRYHRRLLMVPIVRALVSRAEASGVSDPFADMLDEEIKNELLSVYSTCVASLPGRESEGIEMASAIRDAYQSRIALADIARHMVMIPGQEERALELALTISDETDELVLRISGETERILTLGFIFSHMVMMPDQESHVFESLDTHLEGHSRNLVLKYMATHILTLPGQESFAIYVAHSISSWGVSDGVFEHIALTIMHDDIAGAIEVADEIYIPEDRNRVFLIMRSEGLIDDVYYGQLID